MKLNYGKQEISNWNINQLESQNVFHSNNEDLYFEKNKENLGQKTQVISLGDSGYWRTNIMISEGPLHPHERALTLKHITSFQQRSMEDHGKKLKISFENYLQNIKKRVCPQEYQQNIVKNNITCCDQIQQAIFHIQSLNEQKKNSLIDFSRKNAEAQLIIKKIFQLFPSTHIAQPMTIIGQLFEIYQSAKISQMDEDQLEAYVSLNYFIVAEKIKNQIKEFDINPCDTEQISSFEEMISIWVETVFLALNGVFQNNWNRKLPIQDIQGFQTFQTARKIVKID